MSNYTKATNFAAKDALSSGDPNKVVKGAEIDTEYNNIETAVNSKLDASRFPNVDGNVTASDEELNKLDGIGTIVVDPSASTETASASGAISWYTPSSTRPTANVISVRVSSDGSNPGSAVLDVDDSGGTSADYSFTLAYVNGGDTGGVFWTSQTVSTVFLPAGAAIQIRMPLNPALGNSATVRTYVL